MADFTINDTMADLRYEYDDRFIYNDIRSEIGFSKTQTILDETSPSEYEWRSFTRDEALPPPGYITPYGPYKATQGTPLDWRIRDVQANLYYNGTPPYGEYTGFTVNLLASNDSLVKYVDVKNTGSQYGSIHYVIEYKVLIAEAVEYMHEETTWNTLEVRATDADSITKYGRRTMNLVWPTGATQNQMQTVVERQLEKYREPAARLTMTLKGSDDTLKVVIYDIEVSDTVQVVNARLGLNDEFYVDSIEIRCAPDDIPVGVIGLTDRYATETYGIFVLDTSELDGTDRLG